MKNILVIGYGKLGSHLYHALRNVKKKSGVQRIAEKKPALAKLRKQIDDAGIIFICVQDSKIPAAVIVIGKHASSLKGKIVYHASGALTSEELNSLSLKGALTASFHPVQTFERKAAKHSGRFDDIYIALEGNKAAVKEAIVIAKDIKAIPFVIKKENKILHHVCCVMASNYLTTLTGIIEKTGSRKIQINGFNKLKFLDIYMPLAKQTLDNISSSGPKASLTGPIERNDLVTLERHLNALKTSGRDILYFYVLMGIETVKLALNKKSITKPEAEKIYKLFSKYIKLQ